MITETESNKHWNYFISLERDFENLARYVEPTTQNFHTFSIEIARLLLAASSEVDVISKRICKTITGNNRASSIDKYREIIKPRFPFIEEVRIFIPRYGLELNPWHNWKTDDTPNWWIAHNKVKHQRDDHFQKANMENALNAVSGLFVFELIYYGSIDPEIRLSPIPTFLEAPPRLATMGHTLNGKTIVSFHESDWTH